MFAQGDVMLMPVAKAPIGEPVPAVNGRLILAEGEATGHHHSVSEVSASLIRDIEERELYLQVREATALQHQEHDPIQLPPGTYRVLLQMEYTPGDIPRRVAD